MNNINCTQVQSTNDASTVSKCSAVSKNYFEDEFIEEFVDKKKTRASLIHLGYYTRAVILNALIVKYIKYLKLKKVLKFQIISCGAGFDTTYWRLSKANLLNNDAIFIEIDFPAVIQRKVSLIRTSNKLKPYTCEAEEMNISNQIWKFNSNYFLIGSDLSDHVLLETLLNVININYDSPTLFLSECVITYMNDQDSDYLINWMARNFKNGVFINYEQIHPDDGFGEVMLRHFDKLKSSLLSVRKYPDCKSHCSRYRESGFESSFAISEWDALMWLTVEEERKRTLSLELFDEFEEFHLKCVHYVVGIAGNGISSSWIDSFPVISLRNDTKARKSFNCIELKSNLELFRHTSCNVKGEIFLFGGCNRQNRSSNIFKISRNNLSDVEIIRKQDHLDVKFDMVYATATCFDLDKLPFVCLYGGRTSPDKIINGGSAIIFQIIDNQLWPKLFTTTGNPSPRYRTTMVSLSTTESEVQCWIFGGRSSCIKESLSDLWQLNIKSGSDKNLTYIWKEHKRKNENWPCSRMSHSFIGCPKRRELFISGGFNVECSSALNDMWKWSCESESWQKMELVGKFLPRYGHTSHLKDGVIYLVGGVNTLAGAQPAVATIDLNSLTVTEYTMTPPGVNPVLLFNHTSELIDEDDGQILVLGGGGNCFSFGTYINQNVHCIKLGQLKYGSRKES